MCWLLFVYYRHEGDAKNNTTSEGGGKPELWSEPFIRIFDLNRLLTQPSRRECFLFGSQHACAQRPEQAFCCHWRFASFRGFVGYGDADPSNVSSLVRGAEMRIAETRAVNRALRKAYGTGTCSVEQSPRSFVPDDPAAQART